ncbi:hypothetical protein LJ737_12860 [Hymenobacter sp. 15J16-1T3B]|uniref:hypothetical protein n=1 Tax=Hymenobacter sp. 15J16-1T3B TaxID=2886941 RepID=UPI001D129741|nr:hypothetical protein [Hymenobacter sp. 15J16-1T3B]MCC3158132.1 hypothetical protein [Hymenobacter sp. 15J16-1T3B]
MALLFGCAACNKDGSHKPFGWVRGGNRLYYDFYGLQDTIRDCRYLEINRDDDDYRIREHAPNNSSGSLTPLFGEINDIDVVVKSNALYEQICSSCGFGSCFSLTENIYAPKSPFLYQELPTYYCGSHIRGRNYVINTDTTLTVPMGKFKVYIMQHPDGDKSYWNPREGLIMYEVRNQYRTSFRGTLRLNRITR